jgi:pyruvate-formate lyase
MSTLIDALDRNWQGYDWLRERALAAPKYGNAEPYVDQIARDVAQVHYTALEQHRTLDGGRFWRLIFQINANCVIGLSSRTAASPDGRYAQDPIGISLSPNVLDPEPLRLATTLPGQYAGPSARMYGQSLYLAQMDRRLQEFLIARTDHEPARQRRFGSESKSERVGQSQATKA